MDIKKELEELLERHTTQRHIQSKAVLLKMPSMKTEIDFLKDVFLVDLDSGEKARIVNVVGAESGLDHLRVYTQTEEQKESGVVTLFKIYSEEVDATEHRVRLTAAGCFSSRRLLRDNIQKEK